MNWGVLLFPGSNCAEDCFHVIDKVLGKPVTYLWHKDTDLGDVDAIIIPGGFSYGDHLRPGAIAHLSPIMVAVKEFALGLLTFNWQALPTDFPLLVHLFLVAVLMILLPFSKLLHIPGLFFAPTRNQVDNPREKRHVASWALKLDAEKNKMQAK